MSELVSVIIPCYNAEGFVDDAIRSVYEQDYQNIELIVVNDGSTDKSEQRILKWKEPFAKGGRLFKYVDQKNLGLGGAVNTGLKYVTGDYLTLLDADDRYLQGSIREKAEFLQSNPDYTMVRSNGWICSGAHRWLFVQNREETDENYFRLISFHKTNNWAGSYMVRTSTLFDFYQDRNIYPSRFGQNFQIVLPVAYKNKCGFIDKPLMEYIRRPNSLTKTLDLKQQYEKESKNSDGYKDIYSQVINQIISDEIERKTYIDIYETESIRDKFELALRYNNSNDVERYIKWLKRKGEYHLDDRIKYCSYNLPLLSIVLRCLRKARGYYAKYIQG